MTRKDFSAQGRKMSKKEAGRLGGFARLKKYGNPGTPDGRRRGGLQSQITHKQNNTGFTILKVVRLPKKSALLAELYGILAGDGHIGMYQVSVTTNSETDMQHALHVQRLFHKLFGVAAPITKRTKSKAVVVTVSSKNITDYCCSLGLIRGNKVRAQLAIPDWMQNSPRYRLACTKGLFDTDGSVFVDVHTINGAVYRNLGIAFTNRSAPLLGFFKESLESIGLHPTQKSKHVVFLRREPEIRHYFEIIGSSNTKHIGKMQKFFEHKEEYRRGRNGPHSKCG